MLWFIVRLKMPKYIMCMFLLLVLEGVITTDVFLNRNWEQVFIASISFDLNWYTWIDLVDINSTYNISVTGLPKRCNRKFARVESFYRPKFWFLQIDWPVNSCSTGLSLSLPNFLSASIFLLQIYSCVIVGHLSMNLDSSDPIEDGWRQ